MIFSKEFSPGGDQSPGVELRRDGDGFCNSDIPPVGCQHLWGQFAMHVNIYVGNCFGVAICLFGGFEKT